MSEFVSPVFHHLVGSICRIKGLQNSTPLYIQQTKKLTNVGYISRVGSKILSLKSQNSYSHISCCKILHYITPSATKLFHTSWYKISYDTRANKHFLDKCDYITRLRLVLQTHTRQKTFHRTRIVMYYYAPRGRRGTFSKKVRLPLGAHAIFLRHCLP